MRKSITLFVFFIEQFLGINKIANYALATRLPRKKYNTNLIIIVMAILFLQLNSYQKLYCQNFSITFLPIVGDLKTCNVTDYRINIDNYVQGNPLRVEMDITEVTPLPGNIIVPPDAFCGNNLPQTSWPIFVSTDAPFGITQIGNTNEYEITGLAPGNNEILLHVELDCSLIPATFFNTDYFLNQTWYYNGVKTTTQPGADIILMPYLTGPLLVHAGGNYGQTVAIDLQYPNTGATDANIDFDFEDLFLSNFICTPQIIPYTVVSLQYSTDCSNYTTVPNLPFNVVIPQNGTLCLRYNIIIDGCVTNCNKPVLQFKWKCHTTNTASTFCNECQKQYLTEIAFDLENPSYEISRALPVPQANETDLLYDLTCPEGIQPWTIRVENTSLLNTLSEINFSMQNGDPNMLTIIDGSSFSVINGNIGTTTTPTYTYLPTTNPCATQNLYTQALLQYQLKIQELGPGEFIDISFETYRCCTDDANFSFLYDAPKNYNHWSIASTCTTKCGNVIHATPFTAVNVNTGISGNTNDGTWANANLHDVHLETMFTPGSKDITVYPNNYIWSAATSVANTNLQPILVNRQIELNGLFGNDYDMQLLGFDGVTAANISGFVRVNIHCESGLQLIITQPQPLAAAWGAKNFFEPYFAFNALKWTPDPFFSHEFSSGNIQTDYDTNYYCGSAHDYYFYYDLATLNPLLQGAGLDLNQFFTLGKYYFNFFGCCNAAPTTDYKVSFSLLPQTAVCQNLVASTDILRKEPSCGNNPCCWLPLSTVSSFVNVHCPGCLAPGIIVDNYECERTTLGYPDQYDDRASDGGALIEYYSGKEIPLVQYDAYDSLSLNRSTHGDKLEDRLVAHFEPGSDAGEPPSAIACTGGNDHGYSYNATMVNQQAFLTSLQLRRTFQVTNAK